MLRSLLCVVVLTVAVLWFPLWVQLFLFIAVIWFIRYEVVLYIPAIIADVLYAPTAALHWSTIKTVLFVTMLIIIKWFIITKTRVRVGYDVEKK